MLKFKNGNGEIVYLLTKVIEKYKTETGQEIVQNTNRKNYEVIAVALSEISNQLPLRWNEFNTEKYTAEENTKNQSYPYRKYDITGGQIKDALNGIVSKPRSFLVDACYIYLFGKGKNAFVDTPLDLNLIATEDETNNTNPSIAKNEILQTENDTLKTENERINQKTKQDILKIKKIAIFAIGLIGLALLFSLYKWKQVNTNWHQVKADLNILPYKPTQAEIDSLEGIWVCYTGSPQARVSDPNRYHLVVANVVEMKYKDGYFTYKRFGANFNHIGYAQFESPQLVSIHSHIKNSSNDIESPRHTLLTLSNGNKLISAISASWSFDVGDKNNIVGIREVYKKQGKIGSIDEVINTIENASCKCKIVQWHEPNGKIITFELKNELLDNLADTSLKKLINENSIILREPKEGVILNSMKK